MGPRPLACLLSTLLLSPLTAAAQSARTALIQFAPSVVKIEAVDADGRYQLGSGVIVAPAKVVTNCHVTRKAARVAIVKHGLRNNASGQIADTARDLCLLRVPGLEGDPVPIAKASTLKSGDVVTAVGYTGGVGVQLSDGVVVAKHRWDGGDIIQSTNWFSSGASGGALFNDSGALVGVLTFRLRGGAAHYFSAPADWLLDRLHDEHSLARVAPLSGLTFWEEMTDAQPYFLRAAALEQTRQWHALAELALRWTLEAHDEAEPYYTQAVAYEGLGRLDDSIVALRRCTELDPGYSRGWARLAQAYRRQGQLHDARQALRTLAAVDPRLAEQVTADMENR